MTTVMHESNPRARKRHRCDLCNRDIDAGETYNRQRSIYDGEPYVFKACGHCMALVHVLDESHVYWYDDEGYTADSLSEVDPANLREARYLVQWRRKWCRRDGGLYPVPEAVAS